MLSLLTVVLVVLFFLLLALVLAIILRKYRDKIMNTLTNVKNKFFWDGFIRSQSLAYATTAV